MEYKTPFADLLPPLTKEERAALKADLEKRGQLVPVYVDTDDNVLDGHHRLELLENPKVKVIKSMGTMEERRAFVLTNNLRRRNLSPDQKEHVRKAMKASAKALREENPKKWTQERLAQTFGVDQKTVSRWEAEWDSLHNRQTPNTQREPEKPDARVKLTKEGKAKAIERVKAGESITQVAADLGVNKSTVSRIVAKDERQEATRLNRKAAVEASPVRPTVTVASWVDWLPNQDDCDLLLTDPPYMTDVADIGAFAQWLPVALAKVKPTGRAYVCVGAYPSELKAYLSLETPIPLEQVLVWTYRNTLGPSPSHVYKLNWQAILYYKGPDAPELDCPKMVEQFSVQDINAPDGRLGDRYHAWQKPDELAERIIRHATKPGDLVLDPFCCTGAFLVAAAKLGRVGRGCDISAEHLVIAKERGCQLVG